MPRHWPTPDDDPDPSLVPDPAHAAAAARRVVTTPDLAPFAGVLLDLDKALARLWPRLPNV